MRPAILFPLFADTRTLPGVGPRIEKLIAQAAGPRLLDLVFDLPTGVIDRSYRPKIMEAEVGRIVTLLLNVLDHKPPRDRRQPYRVQCSDDTGLIELVFFRARPDYLTGLLPRGTKRLISGRLEEFNGRRQIAHPEYVVPPEEEATLPAHEPVYGLTEGLPTKSMLRAVQASVEKVPVLHEWQDKAFLRAKGWGSFNDALKAAHNPTTDADL
jgi:ATP-dependent DNA helicase RecG